MTLTALSLVLTAAFLHATWNLLAKRVGGGAAFVFLYTLASTAVYLPFVATLYSQELFSLTTVQILFLLSSAVVHLCYAISLQHGYAVGDLSVVYPLARGTGPLLSGLGAIIFFGERPTPIALCGAGSIIVGIFLLAGGKDIFRKSGAQRGVLWGLVTGLFIAAYTLIDANTVARLGVSPLLVDWTNNLFRGLLLSPVLFTRRQELAGLWRSDKYSILCVGILGPLGYILVLTALKTTPVTYVAPAREISMLLGAIFGATFLNEKNLKERLLAAALIAGGVAALALG